MGSLYDAFQRAKEEGGEGGSQLFRRDRDSRKEDEQSNSLDRSLRKQQHRPVAPRAASSSSLILTSPTEPSHQRKSSTSLASARRPGHAATPLSTIPSVYFEEDFHLENPRTFDVVSERSDVVRPPPGQSIDEKNTLNGSATAPAASGRKALATNAILQEKLSWYMDTVEVHLISSISTASTSFFAALGSLRELRSEAADSVKRIEGLRQDLARLDQDMAVGGLKIVSMRRRRENLRKLGETVNQLKAIVNEVSRCEGLVDNGDVELAIDGVEDLERLIAGEDSGSLLSRDSEAALDDKAKLRDLRGTKALTGATEKLDLLRLQIGKAFEQRFLDKLLGDLRRHVAEVPPQETLQRWGTAAQRSRRDHTRLPSTVPAYLSLNDRLRSSLLSDLSGLNRSHHTTPATTAYREAVLREIKSLIRRHLPSSNDDDNESLASVSTRGGRALSQQEKSVILARNLRELNAEDAEDLFGRIYSGVGEALRRLGVQVKVLLDVTSGLGSPPVPAGARGQGQGQAKSNMQTLDGYLTANVASTSSHAQVQDELHQILDMSNLLGQAVDIAQTQITKLLKVRTEQTAHLSISSFLRYFTLNRLFADECEAVSGRGGASLKTAVNGHIKAFVAQLGDTERQQLAQIMDADVWDAKDFGEAEMELLSRITDASTKDAEAWAIGNRVWENNDKLEDMVNGKAVNGNASSGGKDKIRSATLDEQKFILPASVLAVLSGVEKFENLAAGIPSMAQDVASHIIEYLKLFNSRSCQLILGAGATRSAGLKNITTKHLAIASQALSFTIGLIPYIRECLRRHSPNASSVLAEFDKVKRLYQEHQSGIHDKLVEIMSGRAATHVNAMKKIDWDGSDTEQVGVSAYMETLAKETSTLHRVLSKHLPGPTVQSIMEPVFDSYREQWGKAYRGVAVKRPEGLERRVVLRSTYHPRLTLTMNRMLRDAEYFQTKLSKLDGAGETGDLIIRVVKEKHVEKGPVLGDGAGDGTGGTDEETTQSQTEP